jgi:hypothetical protein
MHWIFNERMISIPRPVIEYTVRSKIKKIEIAVINTFQLAARKNLIQMSSDVITTVTVIINY